MLKDSTLNYPIKRSANKQIAIIGGFFFIFGFITWVNGTLIPYLRIACELDEWQAYLVTFAFYISYTVMALPSGRILAKSGMVKGMQLGLVIMAVGCLLFVPAALMRYYPFFLIGLFVVGTGSTLLQTAVNPYITLLGPPEKAAQRISIMGICNKFAGVLAPLILGAVILNNADGLINELEQMKPATKAVRLDQLAHAVILPYLIFAMFILLIAFLIRFAHLPEIAPSTEKVEPPHNVSSKTTSAKNLSLGFLATFTAVGLEVIAGDTIGNYGLYQGLSLDIAKSLTAYTLACTMAGYLAGVYAIPRLISQEKAYFYSSWLGFVISVLVIFVPGTLSIVFLSLLGLANAILWPAIWPQALKGLKGKMLNTGSALLIMGIAGGAIMPLLYGVLASKVTNQYAYVILLPCFIFNIYYSRRGLLESR